VKGGDISNETPPRLLVNLEAVLKRKVEMQKMLGIFDRPRTVTEYDVHMLNLLWRYRDRQGVSMELFVCTDDQDWDHDVMDEVEQQIDRYGTNPFNYFTTYRTFAEMSAILPYRNEVAGVVDPERAWFYGSRAIDLDRLI
jgi:hypothetical protein